jgi:tetratricopeptide (TPR) repeat protein
MHWKIFLVVLLLLTMPASPGRAQASTHPDEDFRQAIELFEAKQYLESRRILERLAETHPTRALYWFNLANSDYMLEDYASALRGYRKVIALGSPLSPPARLYAARAHRKTGEHASAVRELNLLQDMRLPPEMTAALHSEIDLLQAVLLEAGIDLYRSQRYREALQKFSLALEMAANAEIELMKGLALLRLDQPDQAKQAFDSVLEGTHPSEGASTRLREDSQHFLRQIEKGDRRTVRPYWLFMDLAGGYDSNLFGGSDQGSSLSKPLVSADLGAGYRNTALDPLLLQVSYYFSWDEVISEPSLRFIQNSIYGHVTWDHNGWLLEIRPGFRHQILGTDSFLAKPGIGAVVQKRISSHRIGARYDYTRNLSPSLTFNYLEGNIHIGSVYWRYERPRWLTEVSAMVFQEGIGDLVLSTEEPLELLPLAQISVGPRLYLSWSFTRLWSLQAITSYLFRDYENSAQPGNESRRDQQWNLNLRLSRRIYSRLGAFVSSIVTVNRSTLGAGSVRDRNYTQFIISGGLSWDVF